MEIVDFWYIKQQPNIKDNKMIIKDNKMIKAILNFRAAILSLLLTLPLAANATFIATTGDGLGVFASSTSDIIATYKGNSASYSNNLYLVDGVSPGIDLFIFNNHTSSIGDTLNLGSFTIGMELIFRLEVTNTGQNYFTGAASRNPDASIHARVQASGLPSPEFQTNEVLVSFEDLYNGPFIYNDLGFSFTNTSSGHSNEVPEPTTLAILALGMIGLASRRFKKQY
ncbi:PEP-CTERM sorting domain-containing protein [Cognaticolwellia mytili]|uniref:PEP-CTERM sorting domain-containing protein n=1 Tax=Cognaticolwellia mytili TaxID=1888913 RepID=UPI001F38F5B7|nr:PEP-CTERM sorting domain-containing protein [Cognaticolwellia mytili]